MKNWILYSAILIGHTSFSQTADSLDNNFWKDLNLSFMLFETGRTLPINSKTPNNIPEGMKYYFGNSKGAFCSNFASLGLYHKNKFGIEILFVNFQYVAPNRSAITNYFQIKYPEYDVAYISPETHNYLITGLGYRLGYKHHLKKFTLTPKFQIGFNNYKSYNDWFKFPKYDSNLFVEYSIEVEAVNPTIVDYHFLVDLSTTIDFGIKMEIGLKAEYIMIPTNNNYTATEIEYGQSKQVDAFNYKNVYSTFLFGFTTRVVLKKGKVWNEPLWSRK